MMGFISVRRMPRVCVLQHIKVGSWELVQIQKAGSHARAPPEKWGWGSLERAKLEKGELRNGIMKREGISN